LKFKLFEGKYDRISGISVDEIWKIIKITKVLYDLKVPCLSCDELGYIEKEIDYSFSSPVEYDLILKIKRDKVFRKEGFYIDGSSDDIEGIIFIELVIDPDKEPNCYNELNSFLQETIRHEIEHLTHGGYNRIEDRPDPDKTMKIRIALNKANVKGDFVNSYKYYLLEDELGPLVHGMYRKAKTDKKPITTIFNQFLSIMEEEGIINKEKRKLVYKEWVKYAKKVLPHAKYESYEEKDLDYREIKENSKFKLPIGTHVIVKNWYGIERFRNKIGIVIGYHKSYDDCFLVKFDEIFYPNSVLRLYQHSGGNSMEDPTKRSRYFNKAEIEPIDKDMVEEIKRKIEERRLKMLDVDPYGEENWE